MPYKPYLLLESEPFSFPCARCTILYPSHLWHDVSQFFIVKAKTGRSCNSRPIISLDRLPSIQRGDFYCSVLYRESDVKEEKLKGYVCWNRSIAIRFHIDLTRNNVGMVRTESGFSAARCLGNNVFFKKKKMSGKCISKIYIRISFRMNWRKVRLAVRDGLIKHCDVFFCTNFCNV